MKNSTKIFLYLVIIGAFLGGVELFVIESAGDHYGFKSLLLKRLIHVEPLPESSDKSASESKPALYILGGPQNSMENKFRVASERYHEGVVSKILFLSQSGITEYSSKIGRNFTNDEWALEKLIKLGIPSELIEPVPIEKRFFGTLSEAQGISRIAVNRGYSRLILVTAPHHTMRTWLSFSRYFKGHDIKLYIYPSDDDAGMRELLIENMKFIIYKYILLQY